MADWPDGSHVCTCDDCSEAFEDRCSYEGALSALVDVVGVLRGYRLGQRQGGPEPQPIFRALFEIHDAARGLLGHLDEDGPSSVQRTDNEA